MDELVAQIPESGPTLYMVQDANFNVVALCNANGSVLEQYSYDPYGTVNAVDSFRAVTFCGN